MSDKAIVSFADGAGNYAKSLMRLELSMKYVGFDGDYCLYNDYLHISSPRHRGTDTAVPYAFKAHAIVKAIESTNARYILWCDSVIYATKSVEPIFNHVKEHGYLLFDNIGFSIGEFTSDACLEKHGMSRDEAFNSKMLMACVFCIDREHPQGKELLERYIAAASDGVSYQGDWFNDDLQVSGDLRVRGHRHDQSVLSIIAKQMNLTITNAQSTYFAYNEHKGRMPIADTVCIWSGQ